MKSDNTSLTVSVLQNHINRITSHGLTQNQQLLEVRQLISERHGALSEITPPFGEFLSQVPDNVPEKRDWQNTFNAAKGFLNNIMGGQDEGK